MKTTLKVLYSDCHIIISFSFAAARLFDFHLLNVTHLRAGFSIMAAIYAEFLSCLLKYLSSLSYSASRAVSMKLLFSNVMKAFS